MYDPFGYLKQYALELQPDNPTDVSTKAILAQALEAGLQQLQAIYAEAVEKGILDHPELGGYFQTIKEDMDIVEKAIAVYLDDLYKKHGRQSSGFHQWRITLASNQGPIQNDGKEAAEWWELAVAQCEARGLEAKFEKRFITDLTILPGIEDRTGWMVFEKLNVVISPWETIAEMKDRPAILIGGEA